MANSTPGKSQRNNAVPSYIDSNSPSSAERSPRYAQKPQEKTASRQGNLPEMRQPQPEAGQVAQESALQQQIKDVSPELIAALTESITERVTKEVVERLKQSSNAEEGQKTKTTPPQPETADPVTKPKKSATVEDEPEAPPLQRDPSNKSQSSASSPPPPSVRRTLTPPSPSQAPRFAPQSESSRSPPRSPSEKPSGVRFSDRPLPRPRTYSNMELSTVDQKWGRLFDGEGKPTQRLGQFLRGLANYLIEEFPSKKSIVVTPSKMAAYYSTYAVENEIHPLVSIFRAQSSEQISRLYQDLACEHHLVQENPMDPPVVPALTPVGFAHWMTTHILAYPEAEAKRLEKVVLALPIDADGVSQDGKPERLPKQISRYLLPQKEDRKSRRRIEDAISDFFNDLGTSRRQKSTITSSSPPRRSPSTQSRTRPVDIHQAKTPPIPINTRTSERDRRPITSTSSVVSESSGNEGEPVKIERERQPYTAQPGSGKVYTDSSSYNSPRMSRTNSTSESRERNPRHEARRPRTQSTASQNYAPLPRGSRHPTSPMLKGYSSSTPDDIHGLPFIPPLSTGSSSFTGQPQHFTSSSLGSNSSMPPPPPMDRDMRAKDERRARRATADEARMTAEFNSPRDAERWDRLMDTRSEERGPRAPVIVDPRNASSAEDWYKEQGKKSGQSRY